MRDRIIQREETSLIPSRSPSGENVVGDDATEGVGGDRDLSAVGLEVGVPLHEHLVQPIQLLLEHLPDLHPEK